jgi:predicted lipoprotein
MIKKIFSFTFILTLLIFSCSSDNDDNSSEVWEQKSEMLTNWADNFISPSYTTLTNKLVLLEESGNTFANLPDQQSRYAKDKFHQCVYVMATCRNV